MTSEGGSPEGSMPFLSTFNAKTKEQNILWRSQAPYYERVVKLLDEEGSEFITVKESTDIQPNYWLVNTKKRIAPLQVTNFEHPFESIKGINKQLVKYKRKDGLDLSAFYGNLGQHAAAFYTDNSGGPFCPQFLASSWDITFV